MLTLIVSGFLRLEFFGGVVDMGRGNGPALSTIAKALSVDQAQRAEAASAAAMIWSRSADYARGNAIELVCANVASE